ncbi:MAG TPA: hypothetical protein VFK03_02725, partial [Candidatus Saccharimonadales bacterium]|nr:hypothetical protein [Candidatus Saccharimonadales bacterium]
MADFDAGSIEAHLDLDRTAFTAGLAEARRQANALSRESPSVRVDADTRAAETKLDILKAKLIALSSKTYHVGVDVAQHGGTGILSGLKLAGLAGIGAAASSLAPEILGIGSALGVAATGVGAFAAVAIPEFKEIGLSADQLKKKHEALTPPLEKADAAFAKLKATYQQLQSATSGPVFGLASQAFTMLSQVLPSLAPLITSTASGLSGVVSQLGAAFSGSGFKQFLAFAQSNIGPTLNSLTSSLISFGSGFATMLERANPLAGIFLSQIKDLADGTKNLGKSNAFASFVQAAQPVMATLGQAIGLLLTNLGRVVTALLPAAQPVLEFIGNLAKAIGDMVQGAGPALAKLFQGMVGPLTVLVDTLGPAVDTVLGALAPVFDQVLAALVPIVPVLGQLIAQLLPPLADLLSQVVAAVAPLIPSLGQLLLALVPVAQLMIQQLGPIIPIIVSGLVSLIVPIANFLSTLNPAVILGIVAAVAALAAIFFGGPTSIVIAIAAAATLISSHWSQITGAFSAAIGWINGVFKAAWALVEKYIVDPVVAAYNAVVHWLQSVINWVTGTLWPWLKTWGPVALALLAPFIGIPLLIYQHFNQIIGWLQGVWG